MRLSTATDVAAPNGSAAPERSENSSAFARLPVAAKTGTAIAIPSGMLCKVIASITTNPSLLLSNALTATANPSGKLWAVSDSIITRAKRQCRAFRLEILALSKSLVVEAAPVANACASTSTISVPCSGSPTVPAAGSRMPGDLLRLLALWLPGVVQVSCSPAAKGCVSSSPSACSLAFSTSLLPTPTTSGSGMTLDIATKASTPRQENTRTPMMRLFASPSKAGSQNSKTVTDTITPPASAREKDSCSGVTCPPGRMKTTRAPTVVASPAIKDITMHANPSCPPLCPNSALLPAAFLVATNSVSST
mmetsp:Transcript_51668/g.123001  ORF Transcript_51668/g.123001 Transcript_51668/m.123001 type:complete len:307 (+) Transcript_51668:186-1106(+)